MSKYSGLERKIAKLLTRFPVFKKIAKFCYARLMYLKARRPFRMKSVVEPACFKISQKSSFFGYYDKSPENGSGLVLGMVSPCSTTEPPSTEKPAELIVFDRFQEPKLLIPIKAYNWQQGCRAHWLSDDLIIFNDFDASRKMFISVVYSVSRKARVKTFERPVQDSFGTEYFISLSYERLSALRPDYGYRNLPPMSSERLNDIDNDGLWRVEYGTGNFRLLVSIEDACKVKPLPEFQDAVHKFNHVMISPDGKSFIFMHRYLLGKRRVDRLLLADAETGEIKLLSDGGMVSHCFWVNETTVLGYLRGLSNKDGYWLIDVRTGAFTQCMQSELDQYGDGHPHVHGDWFVTDTYPDKARMQHLLLCNWRTGVVKEIGEFFHGFEFEGESRCDLHPRFSPDGKAVFFDSVFSGKRQLYRMDLPQ